MEILSVLALMLLILGLARAHVSVKSWGEGGALLYTLQRGDLQLSVTDWGATITSLRLRDHKTGEDVDIVLGFDTLEPYMNGTSPYFGAIVGRVANRIKNAEFKLNGTTYHLTANDHNNTLHGGFEGYNIMFWRSKKVKVSGAPGVEFRLYSYKTEQGFPGDVDISVKYILSGRKELRVEMEARVLNKATPINLAHHSYWNLAGHSSGSILDHKIKIKASYYTPVDEFLIPTGQIATVNGTAFDFRHAQTIGSRIESVPGGYGYDINYALRKHAKNKDGLSHDVTLEEPKSKRKMEVWSNQPGLQFYTGGQITEIVGKGGFVYKQHAGLCLETQSFPNAINQPNFPDTVLKPGHVYKHTMLYKFKN